MNKESLLQQIEILLETTVEQYHQINSATGRIPQIEIDLVLANLRQTYEYVSMLDYVNRKGSAVAGSVTAIPAEPHIENTVKEPEVEVVHPVAEKIEEIKNVQNENLTESASEDSVKMESQEENMQPDEEKLEVADIVQTPKADDDGKENPSESFDLAAEEPSPKVEMTRQMVKEFISMKAAPESELSALPPAASLFDEILPPVVKPERNTSDETPSLHDKINREKADDNSLVERLQKKRIADLKAAIGINEKFLFINELFEGNLSLYNEGIDRLNAFDNYNEARVYIEDELRAKYNWENSPKADKMLMELIERRFIG